MKQSEYGIFSLPKSVANSITPFYEMSKSLSSLLAISNFPKTPAAIIDSITPSLASTKLLDAFYMPPAFLNPLESSFKYFNENAKALMQFADNISILTKNLNFPYPQLQKSLQKFTETIQINANFIAAVNSTSTIAEQLHSIDFDALFTSVQTEDIDKSTDDYIITDSPVIREFDISDNIVIPMGHNRIRMKTGDFICFLTLIFTVFAYLFPHTSNEILPESESQLPDIVPFAETQIPYWEDTIMLLQEQNQLLLDILESVDTSMSSQAEYLKDMKESLQEQVATFQMYQEHSELEQMSPDLGEVSPDNSQTSPDTVHENSELTQQSTDSAPESPNTYSENE